MRRVSARCLAGCMSAPSRYQQTTRILLCLFKRSQCIKVTKSNAIDFADKGHVPMHRSAKSAMSSPSYLQGAVADTVTFAVGAMAVDKYWLTKETGMLARYSWQPSKHTAGGQHSNPSVYANILAPAQCCQQHTLLMDQCPCFLWPQTVDKTFMDRHTAHVCMDRHTAFFCMDRHTALFCGLAAAPATRNEPKERITTGSPQLTKGGVWMYAQTLTTQQGTTAHAHLPGMGLWQCASPVQEYKPREPLHQYVR